MKLTTFVKYQKQKIDAKKHQTKMLSTHISRDVKYGKYCLFGKKCYIDRHVEMKNFNYFNANQVEIIIESNTKMGSFCSIAPGVMIGLGNHDVHEVSTHPILCNPYYSDVLGVKFSGKRVGLQDQEEETIVGSDVWIGARATIKRGLHIGDGAIIAGGAMVTKDVAPYSIVGGIPAKVIGYRFDQKIIEYLKDNNAYTFWNWEETYLKEHIECLNEMGSYIRCIEELKNKYA